MREVIDGIEYVDYITPDLQNLLEDPRSHTLTGCCYYCRDILPSTDFTSVKNVIIFANIHVAGFGFGFLHSDYIVEVKRCPSCKGLYWEHYSVHDIVTILDDWYRTSTIESKRLIYEKFKNGLPILKKWDIELNKEGRGRGGAAPLKEG